MQPIQEEKTIEKSGGNNSALSQIVGKIKESDSILIALSQNPSVDELATAIGLGMFIDKMNKHATAIYSGATPNVLDFLKPEQQFETNTNGLQDFIIAINKDKADHLRYKLDGDYVKVYITPYRTTITENDLEFSHGDYNVDLVIALNVESADRLDAALSEHGRIMHDATIVNIAAGVPGKFGEIEWADPGASSVAEMVAKLMFEMKSDVEIDKEVATAVLTGIVAATERFANAKTQPETMAVASQLMSLGANQQLISANMIKEEMPGALEVQRGDGQLGANQGAAKDDSVLDVKAAVRERGENVGIDDVAQGVKPEAMSDVVNLGMEAPMVTATDERVAQVGAPATVQESENSSDGGVLPQVPMAEEPLAQSVEQQPIDASDANMSMPTIGAGAAPEMDVIAGSNTNQIEGIGKDYSGMMDEALATGDTNPAGQAGGGYIGTNPALAAAPGVSEELEDDSIPSLSFDRPVDMSGDGAAQQNDEGFLASSPMKTLNPIEEGVLPTVASSSNSVGEEALPTVAPSGSSVGEETLPMPGDGVLPLPPTPPLDAGMEQLPPVDASMMTSNVGVENNVNNENPVPNPVTPTAANPTPSVEGDSMGAQGQEFDPGAFKIPGM